VLFTKILSFWQLATGGELNALVASIEANAIGIVLETSALYELKNCIASQTGQGKVSAHGHEELAAATFV
jgi:hypothetical protein|tara:strand:- start:3670 stop:3879 length:210 start_codon:yes stop_codon:yes gene_type:complete